MKLKYHTATTVEKLRAGVEDRLDWYYDPQVRDSSLTVADAARESRLDVDPVGDELMLTAQGDLGEADARSAMLVYGKLDKLTPQQASDERLWTYLCHVECPKYVARRWLDKRPATDEEAARKVRNHFFANGNRALIRDNGLSRLWWLGFIAHEVDPSDPKAFLDLLLHRQDVRSALIERPSVSMNRRVLRSIYQVMLKYREIDKTLFERAPFRSWMIGLNRRGGFVLLDSLPEQRLAELLEDEAKRALSVGSAGD